MTPLQKLMEITRKITEQRLKPVVQVKLNNDVERQYRGQLFALIRLMAEAVADEILPVLKQEHQNFTADHDFMDVWSDRILTALARAATKFTTAIFEQQIKRLAASTISMAEAATTSAFLKSVNKAVGVDLARVISNEGITDYVSLAVEENVNLIKSIQTTYFDRVQSTVLNGVRTGAHPTKIAKQLSELTGVTQQRAKIIARDQMAKINSDIMSKRQQQSGISYFKWITSKDRRVSGNPTGEYPTAKIKCYEIAKMDVGFGPGVFKWSAGAKYGGESKLYPGRAHINCRCTASPVFEWELPASKKR